MASIIVKQGDEYYSAHVQRLLEKIDIGEDDEVEEEQIAKVGGNLVSMRKSPKNNGYYVAEFLIPRYNRMISFKKDILYGNQMGETFLSPTLRSVVRSLLAIVTKEQTITKQGENGLLKVPVMLEDISVYVLFKRLKSGVLEVNIPIKADSFVTGLPSYMKHWLVLRTKGQGDASEFIGLPNIYKGSDVCWGTGESNAKTYTSVSDLLHLMDYFFSGTFNLDLTSRHITRELMDYNHSYIRQACKFYRGEHRTLELIETILDTIEKRLYAEVDGLDVNCYIYLVVCSALGLPVNKLRFKQKPNL